MKKYTVTWGWQPPQYDRPKGNFRLFFYTQEVEREVTHKDFETGEETTETIHEWLCDVVEYEGQEAAEILRLIKEDNNSLECQKWLLKAKIEAYDKSRHVEDFTISDVHLWLNHDMRGKVKENLETCQQLGEEHTILRFEGMSFPISVELGWQMYFAVLAYARACWNVTEGHISALEAMTDAEEVKGYDYTIGYPEKLAF